MAKVPMNSWISYKALVMEADKVLAEIIGKKRLNANLNGIFLNLGSKGLSPARWILENKDLIQWLNGAKKPSTDELAILQVKIEASIKKLASRKQ